MQNQNDLFVSKITSKDIITAIKNNDANFFQENKAPNGNWAFYRYDSMGRTCLDLATEYGSFNVIKTLLDISKFEPSELNHAYYLDQAVRYLRLAHDDEQESEQKNRKEIVKLFVNAGANPNYKPKDPSIAFIVAAIDLFDDELMKIACESTYPLHLEFIVSLFKETFKTSVEHQKFILAQLKNNFGSLNIYNDEDTLLIAALKNNLTLASKLLEESDLDVNSCGFNEESPLKIIEKKIVQARKIIFDKEQDLENAKSRSSEVLAITKSKTPETLARELQGEQTRLQTLEAIQQTLTEKGAESFSNRFANIPQSLRKYVDPRNFNDLNYDFQKFSLEILNKAAETDEDQGYIAEIESQVSSGKEYAVSKNFGDIVDDVNDYRERYLQQNNFVEPVQTPSNENNSEESFVLLEEESSNTATDETTATSTVVSTSKQTAPTGWFSWLPSCCSGGGYKQVKDENIEATPPSNLIMTNN